MDAITRSASQDFPSRAATLPTSHEFSCELDLLRLALNHVDYGLVVVEVDKGRVQFANSLARDALEHTLDVRRARCYDTGLYMSQGRVVARRAGDSETLLRTLRRTRSGVRGLLSLGTGAQTAAVAVVPLAEPQAGPAPDTRARASATALADCHALLVFAKQQMCDDSTMALFARERGLTSAEGQVLALLCRGMQPSEIATAHRVQISTVRTQLRSIRMKTHSATIREVVQKVSVLPPMARHLSGRGGA